MSDTAGDTVAGKLLVAMPGIGDPRFSRSVIMMCSHDAEHAMGVVINKPKREVKLSEVLGHLGLEAGDNLSARVVMDGGPVRPDRGYVLHSADFAAHESTQDVAPGIRLTATREVLEAVAKTDAPKEFVLALGCSGWGAGQLENELKENAWLVVDADNAIVFDADHARKWERAIKSLGFELSQLSSTQGSA
ncbi:MAG: YqgE/AlgH family protein [Proteobacteria bacterium]|nr:YqgE/AlgH family protein [Pseudomonadota bacterium]